MGANGGTATPPADDKQESAIEARQRFQWPKACARSVRAPSARTKLSANRMTGAVTRDSAQLRPIASIGRTRGFLTDNAECLPAPMIRPPATLGLRTRRSNVLPTFAANSCTTPQCRAGPARRLRIRRPHSCNCGHLCRTDIDQVVSARRCTLASPYTPTKNDSGLKCALHAPAPLPSTTSFRSPIICSFVGHEWPNVRAVGIN